MSFVSLENFILIFHEKTLSFHESFYLGQQACFELFVMSELVTEGRFVKLSTEKSFQKLEILEAIQSSHSNASTRNRLNVTPSPYNSQRTQYFSSLNQIPHRFVGVMLRRAIKSIHRDLIHNFLTRAEREPLQTWSVRLLPASSAEARINLLWRAKKYGN
jgi:hypothetical protein